MDLAALVEGARGKLVRQPLSSSKGRGNTILELGVIVMIISEHFPFNVSM